MNVVDLFSGIGGFSLGLERAGMRTRAFCEIDPYCRRVLARHWPGVPCYDDVRSLTAERLRADGIAADVLAGGFPCQDISLAGKGAGLAGERSGLWREYGRLVGELRPRFVVVENVGALLVRGLGAVLGDLAALGYDAWWDCIPAAAVGAPHRRDRVWIVAYPGGVEHQGLGDAIRREVAAQLSPAYAPDRGAVADEIGVADAACVGRERRESGERGGLSGVELGALGSEPGGHGEDVPDPERDELRDEPGRWRGARRAGATGPGDDGAPWALAAADLEGLEELVACDQAEFAPALRGGWVVR